MLFSFFDAVDWGSARASDAINFLRSIPGSSAPKPSPSGQPYTPPFTGGQCRVTYKVTYQITLVSDGTTQLKVIYAAGAVGGISKTPDGGQWRLSEDSGANYLPLNLVSAVSATSIVSVQRQDLLADNCGDIPNPSAPLPIADDGLFTPNNPVIGDENDTLNPAAIILSPAAPLIAIGGGLALAAAAAAAAQAASDALAAIKKVAESLDALKKLWEKLQDFLEEWDKDRPKNRDIVRQTYGTIEGDGAIDFYPLNNKVFDGIQIDIVVTEVPIGFGKFFGNMSPSRYRYRELGYISFYSINKGIISTHSVEFKRTSLAIPKIAVGFIYHFGLDNRIKGFAFGTFSVRKK